MIFSLILIEDRCIQMIVLISSCMNHLENNLIRWLSFDSRNADHAKDHHIHTIALMSYYY